MKATLRYRCAGRTLDNDDPERSILDISVANKIPHWRECGGYAKCTTCRVRIIDGLANLSPRTEAEQRQAEARDWAPDIRLACQTKVLGDVTLERIVRRGGDTSQLQIETVAKDGGEERVLALIFCDMRGFTPFVERHSAFDVVHIVNRMFGALGEPILLNGGVIYQYVGDEISGLFGLDDDLPERACRAAVRAALGMLDSLEALNLTLEEEFGVQLSVGIGVHYGPVIVGRVGHPTKRQFSVVGDSVNAASRIQGMTKSLETNLLVSDTVVEVLSADTLKFGKQTTTPLRGKIEPMKLHEVDGFAEPDPFLIVKNTVGRLFDGPESFADNFYRRLFAAAPEVEALFKDGVNMQGGMLEQKLRSVVYSLDREKQLALGLHKLGHRHVQYGVESFHYDLFRQPMLDTITDMLGGDAADPLVIEAWKSTVDMILSLMKSGVEMTRSEMN